MKTITQPRGLRWLFFFQLSNKKKRTRLFLLIIMNGDQLFHDIHELLEE